MKRQIDVLADATRRALADYEELEARVIEAWPRPNIVPADELHPTAGTWLHFELDLTYYGKTLLGVGLGPSRKTVLVEAFDPRDRSWFPLHRPVMVLIDILAHLLEDIEAVPKTHEPAPEEPAPEEPAPEDGGDDYDATDVWTREWTREWTDFDDDFDLVADVLSAWKRRLCVDEAEREVFDELAGTVRSALKWKSTSEKRPETTGACK